MLVTGLVERIMDKNYQICLIDPEGDYESLQGCRAVGDEKQPHDSSGGEAWVWFFEENLLIQVRLEPSRSEHHLHKRKYAEGELGTERSLYFRDRRAK
jgi:hypothetical protein